MSAENTDKIYRKVQCLAAYLFADVDEIVQCDESYEVFCYRDGIYRVIDLPQEEVPEYEFAVIALV